MFKTVFFVLMTSILLVTISFAQDWEWAFGAKGFDFDYSSAIATDNQGNVYVAGYFNSPNISFSSFTFVNKGGEDIFLIKLDNSGNLLWAKTYGGDGNDRAIALSIDRDQNLICSGTFESSSLSFMNFNLDNKGGSDIFICKLTLAGDVIWATSFGSQSYEEPTSVTTDMQNNIVIGGSFSGTSLIFGSDTLRNFGGGFSGITDIFVAKISALGNPIWARKAGGVSFEQAHSIATDQEGNVIVVGSFNSNKIGFGNDTLVNWGYSDIFIVKYDSEGNVLWSRGGYGSEKDWANTVTTDDDGNVFIAGEFQSEELHLADYLVSNKGSYDIVLAKFDKNGNLLWANSFGEDIDDYGKSLIYSNGYIYLGGYFASKNLAFGNVAVTNYSEELSSDVYVAKFDDFGNCVWVRSAGGNDEDQSFDIAVDRNGNVFQTGNFESKYIYFSKYNLYNYGYSNIFVGKLNPKLSDIHFELPTTTSAISCLPNPSEDYIIVNTSFADKNKELRIYNLVGGCVFSQLVGSGGIFINIDFLPPGIYFLRIDQNSTFFIKH